MASCQTAQWGSTSPYVKLTVTQTASTATTSTLTWTLQYIADYVVNSSVAKSYTVKIAGSTVKEGTFAIGGKTGTHTVATGTKTITKTTSAQSISFSVSFAFNITWNNVYGGTKSASGSISVPAKTSYKITYNANGGSGAPSAQTKWYGTNLTLSTTKPTRTGYTFSKWNTAAGGTGTSYNAGATYSANAAATLYAQWTAKTYAVTYNANGGTGAPAAQTKSHGTDLTLSSTKPTRTNYTFKGWGTSVSATTVAYAAGAKYTANAAITLYAIWESAYSKPQIANLTVSRCNSDGTLNDSGKYAIVNFAMKTTYAATIIKIEWKTEAATTWTSYDWLATTGATSVTAEQFSAVVGNNALDTESSYSFRVTVGDSGGSVERYASVSGSTFPIDFLAGGKGAAIGKAAELSDTFDVNWNTRFRKDICVGQKAGYLDGTDGVYISDEGFIHLQRTTTQSYNPYIAFMLTGETAVTTQIRYNVLNKHLQFLGAAAYRFDKNILMANDSCVMGIDSAGTSYNVLTPKNTSNNTLLGYDNYAKKSGNTNVYGYDVSIGVANIASPGSFRPYRRRGDAISLTIRTAGFVTSAGADVFFTIPLSVPVIGSPTVTITSGNGFTLRQGNKYTHGSSASVYVTPTSYEATLYQWNGIVVKATFSNTTNVTNNDPIGIIWNGTITFS